jgi:hypothetical protein
MGGGTTPPPDHPQAAPDAPGPTPLRRLTIREYNNTLRDLLGVAPVAGRELGVDQDAGGFAIGGPVTTSGDAARLLDVAEQIAASAAARIATLVPCAAVPADAAGQGECARKFVVQFGRRAFRRPLAADEVSDLVGVYEQHRGPPINHDFAQSIRSVVAAMLMSPFFLYRAELGGTAPVKDGALVRFNPHETASRLSYALWGSMPDDQLFAEADAGRLATPEQIAGQARRLLKDPRARDTLADFHLQWLHVDGLPREQPKEPRFAEYSPQLVQAMLDETAAFASEVFSSTGSLETLLTSTATVVDPALARLYGASVSGSGPQPVTLDAKQRGGILTQASFLATHATSSESNPVRRGAVVLRRLLCTEIEVPDDMDVGTVKMPAPGITTRERFAEHALNPCAGCHRLTDPIGFAFEHYDAIGAHRTTDQGKPVDASGEMSLSWGQLRFQNAIELAQGLARADEVRDCMATQWLRYLLRRGDTPGDRASLAEAGAAFRSSSWDLRELLVALTRTRSFTHRAPSIGEVLQ